MLKFQGQKRVQQRLEFESLESESFNFCENRPSESNEILNGERLLLCRSLMCILNGLKGTDSV